MQSVAVSRASKNIPINETFAKNYQLYILFLILLSAFSVHL